MRARLLLGLVGLGACGRLGFEAPRTGGDASTDAPSVDGAVASDGAGAIDAAFDAPPAAPCFEQFASATYQDNASVGPPGIGQAIKVVAPQALHVTRLEVFTGEVTGTSTLALAGHNAPQDQPGATLGTASFQIALPDGWQGGDLPQPVDLAAGQTAWLIWTFVNGAQATIESSSPPGAQEYKVTFDGSTWNGPYTLYGLKLKLWCDGAHP